MPRAAFVAAFNVTLATADSALPAFKRGATLVEFFEFPAITGDGAARAYAVPAFPHPLDALKLFDFDALHRAGFDHMRVPFDLGPLMTGSDDERRTTLAQLATLVTEINRHGLAVLVTLLPPSLHHELPEADARRARRSEIPRPTPLRSSTSLARWPRSPPRRWRSSR